MSVIVVLIGCSLVLALGFLSAFVWAVRSGQFDDSYTPSMRILFDGRGVNMGKGQGDMPENSTVQNSDQLHKQ